MIAYVRLGTLLTTSLTLATGCIAADDGAFEGIAASARAATTVADHVRSGCSTSTVLGLSRQIADEVSCMAPDSLVPFAESDRIRFTGSAVIPFLSPAARDALVAASAEARIDVISAYRTLPQQFLLRQWFEDGRCRITAAAPEGRSNHETGRALDASNHGRVAAVLTRHGFAQTVLPRDPAHFDHLASPDLRGLDVTAFQRLWNRNHPEDLIAESGVFDAATETRLRRSPSTGFAETGDCADDATDALWVDDEDPTRFEVTGGPWRTSTSVPGQRGASYHVLDAGATGTARWKLGVEAAGLYEVWAEWTALDNRASAVSYQVETLAGAQPFGMRVDQRASSPALVATAHLEPSATVTIIVTEPADGAVIADAIRIVPRW